MNAIEAVTHANPYPYYAELLASSPFCRDESLGLWVASSAEAVRAVLRHPVCRVRPDVEPIPRALLGSPAAEIFGNLVRMNDGERHCPFKRAVSATLASISAKTALETARTWAQALEPAHLNEFIFALPVYTVGGLLGVPHSHLPVVAAWMADFVACLSPISTPDQLERGKRAAGKLLELFTIMLEQPGDGGLLHLLAREARQAGRDASAVIVANGIGFLSQTYEASAGLIGNTVLALAKHPNILEHVRHEPRLLQPLIREVVRFDPPIQNTRRFLAANAVMLGQSLRQGDAILVLLAAANRDPAVNLNPNTFQPFRRARASFTFGLGVHACPGEDLAVGIARAGIERILASNRRLESLLAGLHYRASVNARVPVFVQGGPA